MSPITTAVIPAQAEGIVVARRWWGVYRDLVKLRLSGLVVVTAVVGFVLGSRGAIDWALLAITALGTALSAACASVLNQVMEVERDRLMPRTQGRPLPANRVSMAHASTLGVLCGFGGVALLAVAVNTLAAALAGLTIAIYLLAYTPLKTRSTANTLVGAVVGAIPPMIGWAGASGGLDAGAWVLAALLFVWQIPHFMALAWLYRRDYERGGYRMLPSADPSGMLTARTMMMWSLALAPVALTAWWIGMSGAVYAMTAVGLGAWLVRLAMRFERQRDEQRARSMFLATLAYLPALMLVMVLNRPATGSGAFSAPLKATAHAAPTASRVTPIASSAPVVEATIAPVGTSTSSRVTP